MTSVSLLVTSFSLARPAAKCLVRPQCVVGSRLEQTRSGQLTRIRVKGRCGAPNRHPHWRKLVSAMPDKSPGGSCNRDQSKQPETQDGKQDWRCAGEPAALAHAWGRSGRSLRKCHQEAAPKQ